MSGWMVGVDGGVVGQDWFLVFSITSPLCSAQCKSKLVVGGHKNEHFSHYFTICLFCQYLCKNSMDSHSVNNILPQFASVITHSCCLG